MSLEWIAVFFIFVVLNTALSYRAGRKEGQFLGMVDLAIFLQDKSGKNVTKSKEVTQCAKEDIFQFLFYET